MSGYIYILSNPSMPGLVKIGRTTVTPSQRMDGLHSTGVPRPFELEFAAEVADCHACEKAAHRILGAHRYSANREFFKIPVYHALREVLPVLGDYTLVAVKESHGIEEIEAELRKRREEQQAIIKAQENKRAMEERDRAREKAQRVADLQRQLGNARAEFRALGPRPVERQLNGLTTFLMLCWVPIPLGWLVWLGSPMAFVGPHYEVGYVCIALLVAGFFAYRQDKRNDAAHSKALEPFLPLEQEISKLETAIKNDGGSPAPPISRAPEVTQTQFEQRLPERSPDRREGSSTKQVRPTVIERGVRSPSDPRTQATKVAGAMPKRGTDVKAAVSVTFETAAEGGSAHVSLATGRVLDVRIPAGVKDGAQLRLRGQGQPGSNDGEPGDALITIRVAAAPSLGEVIPVGLPYYVQDRSPKPRDERLWLIAYKEAWEENERRDLAQRYLRRMREKYGEDWTPSTPAVFGPTLLTRPLKRPRIVCVKCGRGPLDGAELKKIDGELRCESHRD